MRDLNDQYYFVQVVDNGGFAPAARALGMQKSKLSRRIAALEERLGVRLIQRSTRKFVVTEIGQAYYQRSVAMLVEADAAQAVIDNARSEPCGTIRMACAPGLLNYQMGEIIAEFMALYPGVEVHLDSTSRRVDVIGEGYDLAVRIRQPPFEESDLVMRKLADSVHLLVASPELAKQYEVPVGPADLHNWPSLGFGPASGDHVWDIVHAGGMKASIRHSPRYITDDLNSLRIAALKGVGVVMLPLVSVRHDLEQGRLIDVLSEWRPRSWIIHAVFPSRRGLMMSIRALLDFMAERCGADDFYVAPQMQVNSRLDDFVVKPALPFSAPK